jgi:hypothetical protein
MNKLGAPFIAGIFFITIGLSSVHAAAIDLSTWTTESYPAVSGFGAGVWTVSDDVVAGDNGKVVQSVNGQPTFFYSDFTTQGSSFTGTIRVTGGDDDYIGFALGFNPGDATNGSADYLLIDWKQGNQNFNFGAPSDSPGGVAASGLAVSRVTGIPTADEFWQHTDYDTTNSQLGHGLTEIARATNLGNVGWAQNIDYDFTFDFGPGFMKVFVGGVLELDILGAFNDGRFGFYNFSQASVTYSGITKNPPLSGVPIPAAFWLFGTALVGFIGISRRRKVA